MASSGATQQETSLQPAVLAPHSPKPKSGLLAFLLLEHDALNCFASDLPCSGLHCSGARDDNDDDFRSLEAWNAFKLFKASQHNAFTHYSHNSQLMICGRNEEGDGRPGLEEEDVSHAGVMASQSWI